MGLGRRGEKVGQSDYCTRYESLQPLVHRTILGEGLGCLCGCQVVKRERPVYKYWKAIFVGGGLQTRRPRRSFAACFPFVHLLHVGPTVIMDHKVTLTTTWTTMIHVTSVENNPTGCKKSLKAIDILIKLNPTKVGVPMPL
jgi:hypothetical protein